MRRLAAFFVLALGVAAPTYAQPAAVPATRTAAGNDYRPMINANAGGTGDSCLAPLVGAYSTPVIAITLVGASRDKSCERRRDARTLADLGFPTAAIRRMCQDKANYRAMKDAGTPCEDQSKVRP